MRSPSLQPLAGCAVPQAELQGQILQGVPPAHLPPPGRSHHGGRSLWKCFAKLFAPCGRAGERGRAKLFHPCLEAKGSFHPATLIPGAVIQRGDVLGGDTASASPPRRLPFGRPGTARGTAAPPISTCEIQLAAAAIGAEPPPGPGELAREGLGSGEDGKRGGDQRRWAAPCKPAFQSLPLSQKLQLMLLHQEAAAFLPAPALAASAAGQTRAASLPCKGRFSSPPSPLTFPLV